MKRSDSIGWMGISLILLAFILAAFDIITSKDIAYGILNFIGALGIAVSSYTKKDFPPVFLNIVWLVVALVVIARSLL